MAQTTKEGPTMGWSTWNTFATNISDKLIADQARAMVTTGLNSAGYSYVNIDDGFQNGRDANGNLLINTKRFPGGLQPLVDYIHRLGLKAGIYSDAGHNTCSGYYGGEKQEDGTGLYEHDDQDCQFFFNEMGFDFIKVDFCGGDAPQNSERLKLDEEQRYSDISRAIKRTGRDVRFNVCRWNYPGTWVDRWATSWRTTHDIYDGWKSVKGILLENLALSAYSSLGHYNDMDMLEVGRSMTQAEDETHFGLWCIMNSPLLIGCDMTKIRPVALRLLKNPELIAVNQDTVAQQAYPVDYQKGCYILVRDVKEWNGSCRVVAIFNPTDEAQTVTVNFGKVDFKGKVTLRDILARKDLGVFKGFFTDTVEPHATRILLARGKRMDRIRYEAETAYISDYQELWNNQARYTGIYEHDANCSAGMKATWLGAKPENDLRFQRVYVSRGGKYFLTVVSLPGDSRTVTVDVNGKPVGTMSLGNNTMASLAISLRKGYNEIRLHNDIAPMPDIDYIDVLSEK